MVIAPRIAASMPQSSFLCWLFSVVYFAPPPWRSEGAWSAIPKSGRRESEIIKKTDPVFGHYYKNFMWLLNPSSWITRIWKWLYSSYTSEVSLLLYPFSKNNIRCYFSSVHDMCRRDPIICRTDPVYFVSVPIFLSYGPKTVSYGPQRIFGTVQLGAKPWYMVFTSKIYNIKEWWN